MTNLYRWSMVLLVFACFLYLSGCAARDTRSSDEIERERQEKVQKEALQQVSQPAVTNFTEKRFLKQLYELRDQDGFRTFTYIVDINGKLHLLCESIGYGIPYATQFTNPQKYGGRPQAEPNGLFMPSSAEGTWIMAVTKKGPKPIYVEPRVIVSPVRMTDEKARELD